MKGETIARSLTMKVKPIADFDSQKIFLVPTVVIYYHFFDRTDSIACESFEDTEILEGGFRDKPGKFRDYHHTCYCLSGLSLCQYSCMRDGDLRPATSDVLGSYSNLLEPVHLLYNVVLDKFSKAHEFF